MQIPTRLSNPPPSTFVDTASSNFVASAPSADAQALRYINTGLTMGNSKLDDLHEKQYDTEYTKNEEHYNSSSAMAIPGAAQKGSSSSSSNGSNSGSNGALPSSPGSPSKRSSLDIEKEINGQNLYKTELCRSFVETGMCRYGSKCQFAHGQNELRPVLRHPKYKTDFCKTFHTIGTCPYGTRCRFIHKKSEVEVGGNSIFLPVQVPEWSIWKDGNTPEGKPHFAGGELEKKPRSISLKERRKTTEVQQLQKLDKNKAQRAIGRQRSNTDSPPPPLRRGKNLNGVKQKASGPLGITPTSAMSIKQDQGEKGHRRRKSTGNSWSDVPPGPEPISRSHESSLEHPSVHTSALSPPHHTHHHLNGHLNGGSAMVHRVNPDPVKALPLASEEIQFLAQPPEVYLPSEVLQDALLPVESVEPAPLKETPGRRRSSSSASRLPIFQELCTANEEEIAIGATASTVVNRVLSSSS